MMANSGPILLSDHRSDVFSQWGEDGMIEKIFELVPVTGRWCVEFGAWDGTLHSNTRLLLAERGWSGVLIEADSDRFRQLGRTYRDYPAVTCLNAMVGFEGPSSLDALLSQTAIPEDFELLSIDIDGNDYHVWDSLERYRPRVVVIEFNPTIPNVVDFVQKRDPTVNHGSSLRALTRLASAKRYQLVGVTETNALFVGAEFYPLFGLADNSPEALNTETKYLTYVFQLYDGTLGWAGTSKLLWDDAAFAPERLQVLPRTLRFRPSSSHSRVRRAIRKVYLGLLRRRRPARYGERATTPADRALD